jgi:nucleotide-binding universal stress UspA family protein
VLVPVDFSPPSRLAVNHGIALARKFHARLTLLNVAETATAVMYAFPTEIEEVERIQREQAWRMLPTLVGPEDQDDLDLHLLVRAGNIEEEISSAIREQKADIVVMGTHGRGLLGRAFIGSVTQHMLRRLPVPVLTVCRVWRPLAFDRILFATDLSEESKEGYRAVLTLARETHSSVSILHSVDLPAMTYAGAGMTAAVATQQVLDDARVQLDQLSSEAAGLNVKVDTLLVESHPAEAILKAAEEACADLIVLTAGRKRLLERALLGSTAERVIRESHLPVLSIPASASAKLAEAV